MKKLLSILFLFSFCFGFAQTKDSLSVEEQQRREKNIQAGNPFKKFGYKPKIHTLSKGKYLEFHDLDSIVKIGSFTYHVKNKIATGYSQEETKYSEATLKPEIVSRWFSPDPLSDEFPSWSHYNFVMNSPLIFTDPTGLAPETIYENRNTGETVEVDDGIDKTIKVNDTDFQTATIYSNLIGSGSADENGNVSFGAVSSEIAQSYTDFYDANNSYDGFSLANVADYLFNRPDIMTNEPIGSAGALENITVGAGGFILKSLGKGVLKNSPKFLKFGADEAISHFGTHSKSIMKALGKKSYNLKNYVNDANHVINNGTYVSELNGYVKLIGGSGSAKYGFVGLNRTTGGITTFHIKTAKELAKKAPSLKINY